MQEQLVTFETAKLAKETGFDWSTKLCYQLSLTESVHPDDGKSGPFGWEKGELSLQSMFHVNGHKEYDHSSEHWYIAAAPTQSLLQKWLREVHRINVESNYLPNIQKYRCLYVPMTKSISNKEKYGLRSKYYGIINYNTYEEALEEGLQEALKLI